MPTLAQHAMTLIQQRTGLSVSAQRRNDIERLLHELSGGDLSAFVLRLRDDPLTSPGWQSVIGALAIGETYFFRDEAPFKLLIPALLAKKRREGERTLNIWSVGCATGEEPYSLAITLIENIPDLAAWTVNLIATDLNLHALEAARRAIYRPWSFRQPNTLLKELYFDPVDDGLQLKPHLREQVIFQHGNLLSGTMPLRFDLIFCRNVLLYFAPEHAITAEVALRQALKPGGWLVLGQSETLRHQREGWITNRFPGVPIYQKPHTEQLSTLAAEEDTTEVTPTLAPDTMLYEEAVRLYRAERPDEAERVAQRIVVQDAEHTAAWLLLAYLAADRHDEARAQHYLDTALRLNPMLADAHYLRALLSPDKARQSLRAALYCQRDHALAGYSLGVLYAQSGDINRAIKLWEAAHRATAELPPEEPLSDFSDLTAGRLAALIAEQLAGWEA